MIVRLFITIIFLGGLLSTAVAGAATGQLRHDPFSQPWKLEAVVVGKKKVEQEAPNALLKDLRATIVSNRESMVNLGGKIIVVGEEVSGLKLLSVSEGEAVFFSNGVEHTLVVGGDELENQGE